MHKQKILYSKAIEMAHLNKYDRVLDAYCGIGTISLIVADMCKEVIGVEINKHLIRNAIDNAKYNNIRNAYFIADECTVTILKIHSSLLKLLYGISLEKRCLL